MNCRIVSLLFVLILSTAHARQIGWWPYQKLVDRSDVVAIVEVNAINNSDELLNGHGDPKRFQSHLAHLNVAWVIKGDQSTKKLDLVFFTYAGGIPEDNGALFINFREKEKHQYLVFLKKAENDRFVPTTGHYDASISVKQIKNDHFTGPIDK